MIQKTLIEKVLKVSEEMHKKSLQGRANFIILSPKIAEIIENLDIKKHRRKKLEKINLKNKL